MAESDQTTGGEPSLLSAGERVDHFEVERQLGRGGMGEVYLALDTKLGRKVALKVVRPKEFDDRESLDRFLQEARVTARFNHPHIVTAYSVGEHRGFPYVALEYLEGESLRERLDRGVLAPEEAVRAGLAVADALTEAHAHSILHRDLKPDNVLLPRDGRLRVVDFGLAKALPPPDIGLAATETPSTAQMGGELFDNLVQSAAHGFTGTPFYMAPEQWTEGPVTEATDVWAFGVMLYEMITGERPFDGATVFMLCGIVCSSRPAPSLREREDVPEALAALVERCLAKDAAQRPSAAEAAGTLRALSTGTVTMPVRPSRKPLVAAIAAGIGVAALALGVALFVAFRPPEPGGGRPGGDGDASAGEELGSVFPDRMVSSRDTLRMGVAELSQVRGSVVAPAVFWGLLHTQPDGRDVPFLSTSRPSPDAGVVRALDAGGLEVTWRLRDGLQWSDGHPLHAEDLVFGLQVDGNHHVVEATAPDRRTFVVTWNDAVNAAVDSIRPLPRHVLEPVFEQGGEDAVMEHLASRPTPSVGPYRVVRFEPNQRLVLEANPHFAGPPPSIARVEVIQGTAEEHLRRFEAAEIDVIAPDVLTVEQARRFVEGAPEAVHIRPSNRVFFLQPDLSLPLLARAEVRRAIMMTIDRRELVTSLYGSEGSVAHAPIVGELPAGVERYDYAPAAARAVLQASGAREVELTLRHGPSEGERDVAALVEEDLEAAGLRITSRELSAEERRRSFRQGGHGGLLLESLRVHEGSNVLLFWNLPKRQGRFDLTHRDGAFDGWVAALVEREAGALYPERRGQLRTALHVAYSERLPQLPLAFPAERVVVHPSLRGWDLRPGDRFGRGLERWYFVGDGSGTSR